MTTAEAHDAVATVMAMLLPVHAAVTENWLVDATATAAERTVNAAYTFLYFEDADGTLVQKAPLSDLRRRSTQRAIDAFGPAALGANIDPGVTPAINEALEGERPVVTNAAELFAGLIDADAAARAQAELAIDSIAFVPLQAAGERIGGLILMLVGSANVEHIRLLGEHVACATVNLRQAQATREAAPTESDLVRTVFDARKTESELQRELMRAERYKRDVSVAIIEATNLRLLKEQFGAALTEALVERMGAALAQHSRDIDVIGQYKESGFTMILSEATASGAKTAAERLLAIARAAAVSDDVPGLELHLACGWATYPEDGKPTLQLFSVAERRMYDPKTQVA
jgi:diguanylate cyclase (GGDEF)-like protein